MTVSIAYWTCWDCGAHNSDGRTDCRTCRAPRQTHAKAPSAQNDRRLGKDTGPHADRPAEAVRRLNKAESQALARARREHPDATIVCQGLTLPLSGGDVYRVDMLIMESMPEDNDGFPWNNCVRLVEVKGGYRGPGWEQGLERYKRARAEYPALRFELWDMAQEARR